MNLLLRKKKNDNYKNKRWQRREEEKVEEAPPSRTRAAKPLTFDPKAGAVADPKQNPLMDLFNIPNDNMQTLTHSSTRS